MSSLAILLVALAVAEPPAPAVAAPAPEAESEIVVVGRRLNGLRVSVKMRDGKNQCQIKVSTGDPEIDQIGCDALTYCLTDIRARRDNKSEREARGEVRREKRASVNEELATCFKAQRDIGIAALLQRKAGES